MKAPEVAYQQVRGHWAESSVGFDVRQSVSDRYVPYHTGFPANSPHSSNTLAFARDSLSKYDDLGPLSPYDDSERSPFNGLQQTDPGTTSTLFASEKKVRDSVFDRVSEQKRRCGNRLGLITIVAAIVVLVTVVTVYFATHHALRPPMPAVPTAPLAPPGSVTLHEIQIRPQHCQPQQQPGQFAPA